MSGSEKDEKIVVQPMVRVRGKNRGKSERMKKKSSLTERKKMN